MKKVCGTLRAANMDYSRFLNDLTKRRKCCMLRELDKLYATALPGTMKMAGGYPDINTFPFKSFSVTLKDGTTFAIDGDLVEPAVQYLPSTGYPPFLAQMKDIIMRLHKIPNGWQNHETVITLGGQDTLNKIFEMTLSDEYPVLIHEPVYASAKDMMRPYNPKYYPVPEDGDGMKPDILREVLESAWESCHGDWDKMPKLLYTVPTGNNPSGTVTSDERKREVYRLACKYNFLILEDDPYYFVQFGKKRPISYLSLDTEGRVLRAESFSKTICAGFRASALTGPKPLMEKFDFHQQVSPGHAPSLSQVVLSELLSRWGFEGLLQHVEGVSAFYRRKLDKVLQAVSKQMHDLVDFVEPKGGVFLWMKVRGVSDTYDMVMKRATAKKIIVSPGSAFMADDTKPTSYIRVSYCTLEEEDIDTAFSYLAELIKEEQIIEAGQKKRIIQNGNK